MATKSSTRPGDLALIEPDETLCPQLMPNYEQRKAALLAYRPRLATDLRNILATSQGWAPTIPGVMG